MSGVPSATIGWLRARHSAFLLAIVFVAGLVGFLVLGRHWSRPLSANQATVAELVKRDGRMYRTNQSEPFTGALIERFPKGELKSRSMLVSGRLEGVSEGWYTNGQMEVREFFKAGISDGLRTKWYSQGALQSESQIKEGQHHGTFRRWDENGSLAEAVEMKHGQPDGISLSYYPSGCLKARTQMQNGKVVEQKFWNDGEMSPAIAAKEKQSP